MNAMQPISALEGLSEALPVGAYPAGPAVARRETLFDRAISLVSREWLAVAAIALMALLIRLPGLGDPAPDFDEQLYHLAGVRMLHGYMPYVDIWDRKPFLLFAKPYGN